MTSAGTIFLKEDDVNVNFGHLDTVRKRVLNSSHHTITLAGNKPGGRKP